MITNKSKNNIVLSNLNTSDQQIWDEANYSWDSAPGTWDLPGDKIYNKTKNNKSLSNQSL